MIYNAARRVFDLVSMCYKYLHFSGAVFNKNTHLAPKVLGVISGMEDQDFDL